MAIHSKGKAGQEGSPALNAQGRETRLFPRVKKSEKQTARKAPMPGKRVPAWASGWIERMKKAGLVQSIQDIGTGIFCLNAQSDDSHWAKRQSPHPTWC